jgi:hypothetical protein
VLLDVDDPQEARAAGVLSSISPREKVRSGRMPPWTRIGRGSDRCIGISTRTLPLDKHCTHSSLTLGDHIQVEPFSSRLAIRTSSLCDWPRR